MATVFIACFCHCLNFIIILSINNHVELAASPIFCMNLECIKYLTFDDRLLANGRGQGHVTRFYPRDAMQARVLAVVVCLSVCLSVCLCLCVCVSRTPVLCQNV